MSSGDHQLDTIVVEATSGLDQVEVQGTAASLQVTGLPVLLDVIGSDGPPDSLTLNLLAGDDSFRGGSLAIGAIKLFVNGGLGNDTLVGSPGSDVLSGDVGDDIVEGRQGVDVLFLGDGNDRVTWNAGDGNDIVEGGLGKDVLVFNGSGANEHLALETVGARVMLSRDVGATRLDFDDIETINVSVFGGVDSITVHDLTVSR